VVYQADSNGGLDEWSGNSSWIVNDGMLVYSGDERSFNFIQAPIQVDSTPNYAVEFEARVINAQTCGAFGVSTRGDTFGSYNVALNWLGSDCGYDFMNSTSVGEGPRITLASMDPTGEPIEVDEGCYEQWLERDCPRYLDHASFSPNNDWHTYRVEVQGLEIRVYINGRLVLQALDTNFADGGRVGLWSNGTQFAVRRFAVEELNG